MCKNTEKGKKTRAENEYCKHCFNLKQSASRRMSFNGAEPKIIIELSLFCLVNEEHLSSDNAEQEGSRAQRLK